MNAAAVHRVGAPSLPIRAIATLLALVLGALPLLMLAYGLSVKAVEAFRQSPILVDLLPLPPPLPPPPPPPPPQMLGATRIGHAAPAPSAAAASAPDAPAVAPVAPPPPPALAADGSTLEGNGTGRGSGGDGAGGSGSGGGVRRPAYVPASWAVVPGNPEILPFDPPRAARERVNGRVLLSCNVLASKRLANCRVVEERPRNYGFGKAALAASRAFQMNPPTRDGVPDERAWIEVPVAFNHRRPIG